MPLIVGFSSTLSKLSTYSPVLITSVSSSNPNRIDITESGNIPESAYMTEPSSHAQNSKTGGPPLSGTAVPLSFNTSIVTNFIQCIASQSSYNKALSQFTDSVNSAVQARVYSQSIWTSAYVITETISQYGFSLVTADTNIFSYAYTTTWTTKTETISIKTLTKIDTPTFSKKVPVCATAESSCGGCTIAAASLQLIYWPVSTAEGNPSSTISWNGTTPRVGLFNGTPFTSGSVYLNYAAVSAINSCGVLGGGLRAGPMITLASDAVSSLIGDGYSFTAAQSFNFANLNYPYAWAAYTDALGDCYPRGSGCQFEVAGGYNPYISLPQQLRDLDPAWAHCTIAPDSGSWDPPYALQPVGGTLTPPSPVYTQGPMVGATPVSPIAQSTLVSVPIATAADALPQPKPWTPVAVPEPTPANNQVPENPNTDPPVNADSSANVNPPPKSPEPLPSLQQTPSDPPPTDPTTTQEPIPSPTPQHQPTSPPIITFPGAPIIAHTTIVYTTSLQTLIPGGPSIIISSTTLSLAVSATAIAVGGTTVPFSPLSPSSPPMITISNTAYTADSASAFKLETQTPLPGGLALTNAGVVLSLTPSATAIVIGDITIPLQQPTSHDPLITVGSTIFTASLSSFFLVGTQSLLPDSPALTISDAIISLFPSATTLLVDNSTIAVTPPRSTALSTMLTLGAATYITTTNAAGDLIVSTLTSLASGPTLTISDTVLPLIPSGTALLSASTIPLYPPTITTLAAILTLGTSTYTAIPNAAGDLVVGTQTLLPGEAVTVAGTLLSLDPAGTEVVIGGTRTVPIAGGGVPAGVTGLPGMGGVVVSTSGGGYHGLGGVVISEYAATPTGEGGGGDGGWSGNGSEVRRNETGALATGSASGIGTGEFAGGAVGGGGGRGRGWRWVLAGVGLGLGIVVGGGAW
ncbi:hypothetical protein MMC32_006503 [Xylographa parallela]|nr:hypothetical protein [Xylographa parallela]